MNDGVPITSPVRVWERSPAAAASLAMPKSRSLMRSPPGFSGSRTMKTFSGLRSRWTICCSCAAWRALLICRASVSV
jgi:hypothetical protein